MLAKYGTFSSEINVATDTVVTGLGFSPKAVLFWTSFQTADGFAAGAYFAFGAAIGGAVADQRCASLACQDNVATTNDGQRWADKAISVVQNDGATTLLEGQVTSLDTDGFTVDWLTVDASARTVHYLALGGGDLAVNLQDLLTAAATGNEARTAVGFQPDCVLFFGSFGTAAAPVSGTNAHLMLGAAASASARWVSTTAARDAQTTTAAVNATRYQRTDSCVAYVNQTTDTEFVRADLASMDSDGFTLNWITANAVQRRYAALSLKGVGFSVGAFSKATDAAPVSQDVIAPGFPPAAVLLCSFGLAATTAISGDCEQGIGFADGSGEAAGWYEHLDATLNTSADCSVDATKALRLADGPSTTLAEADLTRLAGGFRMSWTTNDAVASEVCYVAFAPSLPPGLGPLPGLPYVLRAEPALGRY